MVAPFERFRLAEPPSAFVIDGEHGGPVPTATRKVGNDGQISFAVDVRTWSGCGWPVRPSRSPRRTGSCPSVIAACWSPRIAQRHRARQATRRHATQTADAATRDRARRQSVVGDPQGRLAAARSLRRPQLPGRQGASSAARSRSRSSATSSRSPVGGELLGRIRSATTAPASTAPSPTPADDPAAPTPPNPHRPVTRLPEPLRHTGTGP